MKHLIKIDSTPHGVLGVRHAGRDQQYCEAGELVILEWQPDAKWGLQEAHYTDADGNVTAIDLTTKSFTMPNKDITIGGTFKCFVVQDWTDGEANANAEIFVKGTNGEPVAVSVDEVANAIAGGDNELVDAIEAINPFKGWFNTLEELKAAHTATEGDSAYVKDASPATTWSIYVYDSTASSDNNWADSGTDADTSNVQTFASGQEVNEVHIVNDLTTGGVDNVLSAEQGKVLKAEVSQLEAKVDENTNSISPLSFKTKNGLVVDNYGKILSVGGTTYRIVYYKAEKDCDVLLHYHRVSSYTYNGKVFITNEANLVADETVSVITQVALNDTINEIFHIQQGLCLCLACLDIETPAFSLLSSLKKEVETIKNGIPVFPKEGVNLLRLSEILPNSIVDGTTGKIKYDGNGWRAVEINFATDDVRIFMKDIFSGYYSFLDKDDNILLVAGNNYSLYWGFKLPSGCVKGRFSILPSVSDSEIQNHAYISYCRPLMQDEIGNRVSFEESFAYKKAERPTDYDGGDITAFEKVLCIGNSITEGYFNTVGGGITRHGMSYPDNLARITGCDVTNLGDSGESTASWWAKHQNDAELTGAKCVIIELGINDDAATLDTTTKDAMDAIIDKLKTENQKVKIFLSGIPSGKSYPVRLDTDSYYVKDQWLRNYYETYFSNDAQVFFLDIARYTHICEKKAETYDDYNQGHLSEYGYWRLAKDYANYISYLMYNSDSTFKEIQFIGTDYSRT